MEIMHELSGAFLVVNSVTKAPIENALIFVNGEKGNYIHKTGGLYIFMDLDAEKVEVEVIAAHYAARKFSITLSKNGDELPIVKAKGYDDDELLTNSGMIRCDMTYVVKANALQPKPFAQIKKGGKVYANKTLLIAQETKIPCLRISKGLVEGMDNVAINSDFNSSYLNQSFFYGAGSASLVFDDYDVEDGSYKLKKPLDKKIKVGTLLKPYWKVMTDNNGIAMIPYDDAFFSQEKMDYSFILENKAVKLKVDTNNGKTAYDVSF